MGMSFLMGIFCVVYITVLSAFEVRDSSLNDRICRHQLCGGKSCSSERYSN